MAAKASLSLLALLPSTESDDLSDEQMQQLLKDAENRLSGSEVTANRSELEAQPEDAALAGKSRLSKLDPGKVVRSYIGEKNGIAEVDSKRAISGDQKSLSNILRPVESTPASRNKLDKKAKPTAGPEWFDLPRTTLTPELKRDLQLLRMRSVLDPKRHYKKENGKAKAPEFSQIGTVLEGPTEYYSARISNRDRKRTFVDEIMAVEESTGRFKEKYGNTQKAKTSGRKAYYKDLQHKRSKKRKFG